MAGDQIAGYRLLQEIADYAHTSAWMVQDASERRRVAMIVADRARRSGDLLAALTRLRERSMGIRHPNIAPVERVGVEGQHAYATLPLVRGVSIAEFCERVELHPAERLLLVQQLGHALQRLERLGMRHGRVGMATVLVRLRAGTPSTVLLAPGIAAALGEAEQADAAGLSAVLRSVLRSCANVPTALREWTLEAMTSDELTDAVRCGVDTVWGIRRPRWWDRWRPLWRSSTRGTTDASPKQAIEMLPQTYEAWRSVQSETDA